MENLIISQSQKSRDLENIYSLYDELANIVNACRTIAERYKYPEFSTLCDNAIELSGDFSKLANFVLNPESENLFDSIIEKESFFNNKILKSNSKYLALGKSVGLVGVKNTHLFKLKV